MGRKRTWIYLTFSLCNWHLKCAWQTMPLSFCPERERGAIFIYVHLNVRDLVKLVFMSVATLSDTETIPFLLARCRGMVCVHHVAHVSSNLEGRCLFKQLIGICNLTAHGILNLYSHCTRLSEASPRSSFMGYNAWTAWQVTALPSGSNC